MATIEGLSSRALLRSMSCFSSTSPAPFLRLRSTVWSPIFQPKLLYCKNRQLHHNHWILSAYKKNATKAETGDTSDGENVDITSKKNKKTTRRGRKKSSKETEEEIVPVEAATELTLEQVGKDTKKVGSTEELQNVPFYMRHLDLSTIKLLESSIQWEDEGGEEEEEEEEEEEITRPTRGSKRKATKKSDSTRYTLIRHADRIKDLSTIKLLESSIQWEDEGGEEEEEITRPTRGSKRKATKKSDSTRYTLIRHADEQEKENCAKLENMLSEIREHMKGIVRDDNEDANKNYTWKPLVICFGAAKASFIPYARPANRIFDRKIHEAMHELYWMPDRFFRAPGSAASSVATELARLDGRVEFMGKLGIDQLGMELLYKLNVNGVRTQCVKMDDSTATAVSHMKLTADGRCLKSQCVQPCAEDSFLSSDVRLDILKEAKMLYFNSSALLDPNSKSTVMEVIKIMKSQGSLIFFDLNLPLLLWHSPKETKSLLKESFAVSNFIEMTQQELDFLCGIKQNVMENEYVKFVHRSREEVEEVWHDGLEVLFVTNGTSMISYYTKERDGFIRGTEDVPIKPSGCEMSASGDAVVAALMKMLVLGPDMATDPSYLHTSIKYAIQSGLIAQLLLVTDLITYRWPPNDDENEETVTTDEDTEDDDEEQEESYQDRAGKLVA
ncbi:Fructokinase-2 [Rhynchospora pubera]|uniref:Fructokinase-2 n=1 Tax=Rhynchospora pubera TaxID=906938 RepID=A0AAV8GT65_9POAL|nr:Fructokinase-2 [Rhynchospora pubera]KAJ4807564.1 Fructokinase-2 [Rhynchospora pubera]